MYPGPDLKGFVWDRAGRALMQFMDFLANFAMSAVSMTLVTLCYPLCEMRVGMLLQYMPTRIRYNVFLLSLASPTAG